MKGFGKVSKALFTDVAEYIWSNDPNYFRVVNDKNILAKCLKIFSVWEREFLFTREYISKLKAIIQEKVMIRNWEILSSKD